MSSGALITGAALARGLENGGSPFVFAILFAGMCNFIIHTVRVVIRIWRCHVIVRREVEKVEVQHKIRRAESELEQEGKPDPIDDPISIWHHEYFQPYCICPRCLLEALHWINEPSVSIRWRTYDVVRTCRECGNHWGQNLTGTLPAPLQGPMLPLSGELPIGRDIPLPPQEHLPGSIHEQPEPKDVTLPWEQYPADDKITVLNEAQTPPSDVGSSWGASDALWYLDEPEA